MSIWDFFATKYIYIDNMLTVFDWLFLVTASAGTSAVNCMLFDIAGYDVTEANKRSSRNLSEHFVSSRQIVSPWTFLQLIELHYD